MGKNNKVVKLKERNKATIIEDATEKAGALLLKKTPKSCNFVVFCFDADNNYSMNTTLNTLELKNFFDHFSSKMKGPKNVS